jgi:hypothetical protein
MYHHNYQAHHWVGKPVLETLIIPYGMYGEQYPNSIVRNITDSSRDEKSLERRFAQQMA